MILKRASVLATSQWSGGTTTELAIFPPEASYAARNFDWRISTATVEAEASAFTHLPGYQRLLMILEGRLEMLHDTGTEKRSVSLDAFEQSHFDGAWKTTGFGKVRDFNVMIRQGKTATIELKTTTVTLQHAGATVLYCLTGAATIAEQTVYAGDVLQLAPSETCTVVPSGSMQLLVVYFA